MLTRRMRPSFLQLRCQYTSTARKSAKTSSSLARLTRLYAHHAPSKATASSSVEINRVRNIGIIAHIDAVRSTLLPDNDFVYHIPSVQESDSLLTFVFPMIGQDNDHRTHALLQRNDASNWRYYMMYKPQVPLFPIFFICSTSFPPPYSGTDNIWSVNRRR